MERLMIVNGPGNCITDVSGVRVGHHTDLDAGTGCSVILCEDGAVGARVVSSFPYPTNKPNAKATNPQRAFMCLILSLPRNIVTAQRGGAGLGRYGILACLRGASGLWDQQG